MPLISKSLEYYTYTSYLACCLESSPSLLVNYLACPFFSALFTLLFFTTISKCYSKKIFSVVYKQKYISTGFVTDGEFSSLRTRGSKRAISVVQLVSDARSMSRSTRITQIERSFKLDARGNYCLQ